MARQAGHKKSIRSCAQDLPMPTTPTDIAIKLKNLLARISSEEGMSGLPASEITRPEKGTSASLQRLRSYCKDNSTHLARLDDQLAHSDATYCP